MAETAREEHQGCKMGPIYYSADSLKILKEFAEQPQEHLGAEGSSPNRMKSQALLANGFRPEHLVEE